MLTEAEAEKHPLRNVITRALGGALQVTPDASEIEIEARRRRSCSVRTASPAWSLKVRSCAIVTASNGDLEKACQQLIDAANERGGLDNVTAVLVETSDGTNRARSNRLLRGLKLPPPSLQSGGRDQENSSASRVSSSAAAAASSSSRVDNEKLFSKKEEGRFPTESEIVEKLRRPLSAKRAAGLTLTIASRPVHPEVGELRPKLKEILYDCAVEIRATKAALYLVRRHQPLRARHRVRFPRRARQFADFNDPLVDRCGRGRTPFFVNGVGRGAAFLASFSTRPRPIACSPRRSTRAESWSASSTCATRPRSCPSTQTDLPKAQSIAERMVELFATRTSSASASSRCPTLTGARRRRRRPRQPQLARSSAPAAGCAPAVALPLAAPPPHRAPPRPVPHRRRAHRQAARTRPAPGDARASRRAALAERVLVAAAHETLSESRAHRRARRAARHPAHPRRRRGDVLRVRSHRRRAGDRGPLRRCTDEARNILQSKLNVWLTKRGEGGRRRPHAQSRTPFGTSGTADHRAAICRRSSPRRSRSARCAGLYLTVAFAGHARSQRARAARGAALQHLQLVDRAVDAAQRARGHATARGGEAARARFREVSRAAPAHRRRSRSSASRSRRYLALTRRRGRERAHRRARARRRDAPARLRPPLSQDATSDAARSSAFLREHPSPSAPPWSSRSSARRSPAPCSVITSASTAAAIRTSCTATRSRCSARVAADLRRVGGDHRSDSYQAPEPPRARLRRRSPAPRARSSTRRSRRSSSR